MLILLRSTEKGGGKRQRPSKEPLPAGRGKMEPVAKRSRLGGECGRGGRGHPQCWELDATKEDWGGGNGYNDGL